MKLVVLTPNLINRLSSSGARLYVKAYGRGCHCIGDILEVIEVVASVLPEECFDVHPHLRLLMPDGLKEWGVPRGEGNEKLHADAKIPRRVEFSRMTLQQKREHAWFDSKADVWWRGGWKENPSVKQ